MGKNGLLFGYFSFWAVFDTFGFGVWSIFRYFENFQGFVDLVIFSDCTKKDMHGFDAFYPLKTILSLVWG